MTRKTKIASLVIALLASLPLAASASVSVNHVSGAVYEMVVTAPEDVGNSGLRFSSEVDPNSVDATGLVISWPGGISGTGTFELDLSAQMICTDSGCGTFHSVPPEGTYYVWQNYELEEPPWVLVTSFVYPYVSGGGSGPDTSSVDTIITNASSTFTTAVGFNWSDVVLFMKTLLLLVIGSGLGLLETLLPYIIALVTIGAIVYFLYRAFRFFRH